MKKVNIIEAMHTVNQAGELIELIKKIQPEFNHLLEVLPQILPQLILLFEDMRQIYPRINTMQETVKTSLESMPTVKTKIEKVAQETESTTMSIMDRIDTILDNTSRIQKMVKEVKAKSDGDADQPQLDQILEANTTNQNLLSDIFSDLQFQDITTQQLNSARGILIDISKSLGDIIERFSLDTDDKQGTYDHEATMDKT
jgi:hypothetical protein